MDDVRELPARIEALLDELTSNTNPVVVQRAEELVASVVQLYGEGLSRIVGIAGRDVLAQLAHDDLVANLLLVHGLHPDPVDVRIQQALDRVRPYLGSHAGGIEFLGVDDAGVARLQLLGGCDGCAGSAATVHDAVERAVLEAAPEVSSVDVAGMVTEAKPALLQIGIRCPDGLVEAVSP